MMLMDLDFDIEFAERGIVGRGKEPSGCSCLASCCCCSGCRAELPSDGFLADRA